MKFIDKNDIEVKDNDVIDLHQTVNGQNLFVVKTVNPLDIRYHNDIDRKYEYDKVSLLNPSFGETSFEIVDKWKDEFPMCNGCGEQLEDEYSQREGYCSDCI